MIQKLCLLLFTFALPSNPDQRYYWAGQQSGAQDETPPILAHGADDIFWVSKMHAALEQNGYCPGDEEAEVWLFGDQTLSALLTFQVCYFYCFPCSNAVMQQAVLMWYTYQSNM